MKNIDEASPVSCPVAFAIADHSTEETDDADVDDQGVDSSGSRRSRTPLRKVLSQVIIGLSAFGSCGKGVDRGKMVMESTLESLRLRGDGNKMAGKPGRSYPGFGIDVERGEDGLQGDPDDGNVAFALPSQR